MSFFGLRLCRPRILKIDFPAGKEGDELSVALCLADGIRAFDAPPATVAWRFAGHAAKDSQPWDRATDRMVAELYAARARDEALELNRAGRYSEARSLLRKTAGRIGQYAGDDRMPAGIVSSLQVEMREYSALMDAMGMTLRCHASKQAMMDRIAECKARRKRRLKRGTGQDAILNIRRPGSLAGRLKSLLFKEGIL